MAKKNATSKDICIEEALWKTADKLRKNVDAAEYKHVVLGLIFLKYISDSFEELYQKLKEGKGEYEGADPEDIHEYRAENVFFVPLIARWNHLQNRAKLPTIGKDIDDAMDAIERENPSLKGVLPKQYSRPNLDPISLGALIDVIGTIALGDSVSKSKDVLGHVYEYFLGKFALAEGKKGGQFYTPRSIVQLLVEMLEPYKGRVFDPCCGSGGMFVQSDSFVKAHSDRYVKDKNKTFSVNPSDYISIYGQESNLTTWRLCKMNLAIRGIDSTNIMWNNEGSFLKDAHKDLKADFVIANPPFNDSDWGGQQLSSDGRWKFGTPSASNANFAWVQHFLYHLGQKGTAGFVLAKGSMSSKSANEGEIRKGIIDARLVDCIVNLPPKLFLNTQIPACLWFLSRAKENGGFRNRRDEILFIDARDMGQLINRRTRELTDEDVQLIAGTYHNWRNINGDYEDVSGFCKSASLEEVAAMDYVLTPGRYVGLADDEEDFNYEERVKTLTQELKQQMNEADLLDKELAENLKMIGVEL